MKFGSIVRFAPLLIVLSSGVSGLVSGLRPRRSLLPDDDHAFLRRGDGGPDQLPPIILPPTGSRHLHLTVDGPCEPCCDNYDHDGCYLCKHTKSGKDKVKCTARHAKSQPDNLFHNGHNDIDEDHVCPSPPPLNDYGECYHEGPPCDVTDINGDYICGTEKYCTDDSYRPYGPEFCTDPNPDPSTCPCTPTAYHRISTNRGLADGYEDPVMACSAPDGYTFDEYGCGCVPVPYYRDFDQDTFGDPNHSIMACSKPVGYVDDNTDCDDNDPNVNPDDTGICGACGLPPYSDDEGEAECHDDGSHPNSRYQGNENFLRYFDHAPCDRTAPEYRLTLPQYPNFVLTLEGGDFVSGEDEASWMIDAPTVRFFLLDISTADAEKVVSWTSNGICFFAEGEEVCPCPDDLNSGNMNNYQLGSVYWRTGNIPAKRMVLVVVNGVVADVLPRDVTLYTHFFSDECSSYIRGVAGNAPPLVLNNCGVPDYNDPLFSSPRCYPTCGFAYHYTSYFQDNHFLYGFDTAPCGGDDSTVYNLELPAPYDDVVFVRNSDQMIDNSGVKFYLLDTNTHKIIPFETTDRMCFVAEGEEQNVRSELLNMVYEDGDWNDYSLGSAYYCGSSSFADRIALVLVNGRIAGTYPHDPSFFSSECSDQICSLIDPNANPGISVTWYKDSDGDGFGDPGSTTIDSCSTASDRYVLDNTDCDDTDFNVNPNAIEICDGVDNNCDGQIDEGFITTSITLYRDSDSDDFGDPENSKFVDVCDPISARDGFVEDKTDCDDTDSNVNPNAIEICDGVDNNCDGQIDEGFSNVNPDAIEICDGVDNNCNGQIDEGYRTVFVTSQTYSPGAAYDKCASPNTFNSVSDANQICQNLANDNGLVTPSSTTFVAWLCDSTVCPACCSLSGDHPQCLHDQPPPQSNFFVDPTCTTIASSWADLVPGITDNYVPITLAEDGITSFPSSGLTKVWTGCGSNGSNTSQPPCDDWKSSSSADSASVAFTRHGVYQASSVNCNESLHLYCFEKY